MAGVAAGLGAGAGRAGRLEQEINRGGPAEQFGRVVAEPAADAQAERGGVETLGRG